jgi:hypothetical protein
MVVPKKKSKPYRNLKQIRNVIQLYNINATCTSKEKIQLLSVLLLQIRLTSLILVKSSIKLADFDSSLRSF